MRVAAAAVAVAATQAAKYRRIREEQERRWEAIDKENKAMKQLEQLKAEAMLAEQKMVARRASYAQTKHRSQSRKLVHKGVQPCLRNASRERRQRRQLQDPERDAAADAVAVGVCKLNIDPALSDVIMSAEGPSMSVVGWNVSDESVRELAALPYDEWKEEMRARKRQAEAEANAAAAAMGAAAETDGAAATKETTYSAERVHFSRRGSTQSQNARRRARKPNSPSEDENRRTNQAEMAECTFRPRTGIPKAMAMMRQVLDAPDH